MTFQRLVPQHKSWAATVCEQGGFIPRTWLRSPHRDYLTLQWYMPCLLCFSASSAGNFSFLLRASVLETFIWQDSPSIPVCGHGPGTCLPWDSPTIRMFRSSGFVPGGSLTVVSAHFPPTFLSGPALRPARSGSPGQIHLNCQNLHQTMSPVASASSCTFVDIYEHQQATLLFSCSKDLVLAEVDTQFPWVWPWSVFILEEGGCHTVDISCFSPTCQ